MANGWCWRCHAQYGMHSIRFWLMFNLKRIHFSMKPMHIYIYYSIFVINWVYSISWECRFLSYHSCLGKFNHHSSSHSVSNQANVMQNVYWFHAICLAYDVETFLNIELISVHWMHTFLSQENAHKLNVHLWHLFIIELNSTQQYRINMKIYHFNALLINSKWMNHVNSKLYLDNRKTIGQIESAFHVTTFDRIRTSFKSINVPFKIVFQLSNSSRMTDDILMSSKLTKNKNRIKQQI